MALSDDLLLCNFPKCRVKLSGQAWVTACSHIFCDQHGSGEFSRSPAVCPACNSTLSSKLDVIRSELCPSEEQKAMMLAGLRPEIVLDICSRALAFWTYQVLCIELPFSHGIFQQDYTSCHSAKMVQEWFEEHNNEFKIYQERLYQEYNYSKAEGHLKQVEKVYTHQIQSKDAEMGAMKGEVNSLKKILEEYKRKYSELSEKLMERNRQYNKLQGMYDGLRLRNMAVANREASSNVERTQQDQFMGNRFPAARTPPLRSVDADFRPQTFFCTSPFDDSGNITFGSPGNRTDQQNMASSRAFKVMRM